MNGLLIQDDPRTLRFRKYHETNPNIYILFNRFARELIAKGHKRGSAKQIIERIRWFTMTETKGDTFKINNNYAPDYARLWMRLNPEYQGFFNLRDRKK